jgi:hypothetical protein
MGPTRGREGLGIQDLGLEIFNLKKIKNTIRVAAHTLPFVRSMPIRRRISKILCMSALNNYTGPCDGC